jgi:hypothetical protein
MSVRRFALMALVLAVAAAAKASDGRLEINQACVAAGCFPGDSPGLPVETSPGGSYVLTSDLFLGSVGAGVFLKEGGTLDLNGFTIEGSVICTGAPATCDVQGANGGGVITEARAVVRNGTIRKVTSYGIRLAPHVRVERMTIEQNAASGISAGNDGVTGVLIQDNQILQNGGAGIAIAANGGTLGARVLRNTVYGNESSGVTGAVSLLVDNAITSNGGLGAVLNYGGSTAGFGGNQFWNNNGGNANPQMSGGLSIGTNICGLGTTCP